MWYSGRQYGARGREQTTEVKTLCSHQNLSRAQRGDLAVGHAENRNLEFEARERRFCGSRVKQILCLRLRAYQRVFLARRARGAALSAHIERQEDERLARERRAVHHRLSYRLVKCYGLRLRRLSRFHLILLSNYHGLFSSNRYRQVE